MRIAVLGLGNVLMGDDGLGPNVIQQLQNTYEFPDTVEVVDLGTPGLDLIPFLTEVDAVIFVDTVRSTGSPGDVRVYHTDDLLRHAPRPRVSPHDPGVKSALLTLKLAGIGPSEATLVGVIPSRVEKGPGLSGALEAAVPVAAAAVVRELARLGASATPRDESVVTRPWWEQPVVA